MITEARYETFPEDIDYTQPTIFLAGPTVRGNQTHLTSWRFEAVELFKANGFEGSLIIPEFSDKTESDQVRYDLPQWEFSGLRQCDCIMFWIPRTKELIGLTTNYELGYWVARNRDKVVYGRPHDAYRVSYCDIMWVEDLKNRYHKSAGAPIYTTLEKTVRAAICKATTRHFLNAGSHRQEEGK